MFSQGYSSLIRSLSSSFRKYFSSNGAKHTLIQQKKSKEKKELVPQNKSQCQV